MCTCVHTYRFAHTYVCIMCIVQLRNVHTYVCMTCICMLQTALSSLWCIGCALFQQNVFSSNNICMYNVYSAAT